MIYNNNSLTLKNDLLQQVTHLTIYEVTNDRSHKQVTATLLGLQGIPTFEGGRSRE